MQFPESWLRSFCNPAITTEQLADKLTMAGLEVEDLTPAVPPFSGVVVGEILTAEQHPNADRLRVCTVSVGQGDPLQIVCGAPNARVGIKVPCATVGAVLPPGDDGKPFTIGKGKLRGVESFGMLCSARELKLSEDHGGLLELPLDAPVGQNVRQCLNLDDTLFTLKLTPNLGHCLSVYGVAREVAALTGAPLAPLPEVKLPAAINDVLPVKVQANDLCGRFSGRIIRGVNLQAKTPAWMVERLARCGQRSVAPLVDISNYVMFELGQPSHIFDLGKIHGGLTVRWGQPGETLKLLNGNTVTLDEQVGVIADEQAVESLAGIMGGDATAVSDDTRDIYVEAAFWWPEAVAGRSRRYNFSTDAGHRYERGVDPSRTVQVIERITQLVLEICGTADTRIGPIDDHQPNMPKRAPVALRVARAAKVIGMPLTQAQCADALGRLGLAFTAGEGTLTVTPPMHRFDITIEEDLIEEVARIVGFENLPNDSPVAPIVPRVRPETSHSNFDVRHALARMGYLETINFSFVEERWETELAGNTNPVRLLNPIASHLSVMRSSLIGSLIGVLKLNLDRKADRVRVFELGRVFRRDDSVATTDHSVKGVNQPMRVAGLVYGKSDGLQWGRKEGNADFFDVKGDVENLLAPAQAVFAACEHPAMHPGRSASVSVGGQVIGHVGELHPRWRQAYDLPLAPVLFELDLSAAQQVALPSATQLPKQQDVQRDLAFLLAESVTHDQIQSVIRPLPVLQSLLQNVQLFDVFRPTAGAAQAGLAAGEKSLALRLTFNGQTESLTDAQIDSAVQAVKDAVAAQLGARLR